MSGGIRRFLNLGLFDGRKRAYSLRRLDLFKMDLFHGTPQDEAPHGKTLTPAKACAPNTRRRKTGNTQDLAMAEAAAPMINPPKSVLLIRPPQVSYSIRSPRAIHFMPTTSESKVVLADWANRMLRSDIIDGCSYIDTLPCLHGLKHSSVAISVPPTDLHLLDGEDTGDLYIIDSVLHPNKAVVRPQFEALVWRGLSPSLPTSHRFWHCDILPLPPWITHHTHAFVYGHGLIGGDTICFSISGAEGFGTYCFHIATREWSKVGNWLMPFDGKADYIPELGLWFGVSDKLPCAADLSGVVRGEEPPPEKIRIWAHDDLPKDWQPSNLFSPRVISLGSGRFTVVDFLDAMVFDKDCNEMVTGKQFALFTGMEVAYGNKGKSDDGKNSSNNNNNGSKGKGMMRGLRMIKHKSCRHMFHNEQRIEEVL